ncbi:MAG: hypothetical protein AAGH79_09135, partial [Bacteroidota bacterium]
MSMRMLLVFTASALALTTFGQSSFLDDFETYAEGSYLSEVSTDWTTLFGNGGAAEDLVVTSEDASSGEQSIKIQGDGGFGIKSAYLPFGEVFETGAVEIGLKVKIPAIGGISIGFLHDAFSPNVDQVYLDFYSSGVFVFNGDVGNYNQEEWQSIQLQADLTLNQWTLLLNGESVGTVNNAENTIAGLTLASNITYGNEIVAFVDDIAWTYTPVITTDLDGALTTIDLKNIAVTGSELELAGTVRNVGFDNINSFDLIWESDGQSETMNFSGLDLAFQEELTFLHEALIPVDQGSNEVTVSLVNINGGQDENIANNSLIQSVEGIQFAPGRKVVFEEGTGTWCGWCPRGEVFIEQLKELFPDRFIPIAVHNSDPMENTDYNTGLGMPYFPGMSIERTENTDFVVIEDLEEKFLQRIAMTPPATLESFVAFDAETRLATIRSSATASQTSSGAYRLSVVLVENGVTGSGSGYEQANVYSGGVNGPMGGFENLPSPVSSDVMVYNHVGRELVGGFDGVPGSLPSNLQAGETYNYEFGSVYISPTFDVDQMRIVTLILDE